MNGIRSLANLSTLVEGQMTTSPKPCGRERGEGRGGREGGRGEGGRGEGGRGEGGGVVAFI